MQLPAERAEQVHRLTNRDAGVELGDLAADASAVVAADSRDNRLAREALAEMDDAVVVADNLDVAVVVLVVQAEQFPE